MDPDLVEDGRALAIKEATKDGGIKHLVCSCSPTMKCFYENNGKAELEHLYRSGNTWVASKTRIRRGELFAELTGRVGCLPMERDEIFSSSWYPHKSNAIQFRDVPIEGVSVNFYWFGYNDGYSFYLDTTEGSVAKYVKNSCKPNAAFQELYAYGKKVVFLVALEDIPIGRAITVQFNDFYGREW